MAKNVVNPDTCVNPVALVNAGHFAELHNLVEGTEHVKIGNTRMNGTSLITLMMLVFNN